MKKKIIAMITGLAIVAMIVPAPAGATTIAELEATIAELQEQLNTALAQLADLGGGGVGVTCIFTRALAPGSTGADVLCLQQYLNDAGYTVAASGVGSAGNETQYYGSLTTAAVGAWQDGNGVAYGAYRGYFGPISQAKYDALAAVGEEEEEEEEEEEDLSGGEGSLVVTRDASVGSGVEVYETSDDIAVLALKAKAGKGSDVKIERLDVNFDVRPWLYLDTISVWDGDDMLTEVDVTKAATTEVTVGSDYKFRIYDVDVVVDEDSSKVLTIKVDGSSLPAGTTTKDLDIDIQANAVRAVDAAGINIYEPISKIANSQSFTVKEGTAADIEILANADNPTDATLQIVSDEEGTEDIVLLRADLKARYADAVVNELQFGLTSNASGTQDIFGTATLYDGEGNSLGSTSTEATTIFSELNLNIAKDETKTVVLKVDIYKTVKSGHYYAEGNNASATLAKSTTAVSAEDAETFADCSVVGSAINGKDVYFRTKAPSLALVSQTISAYQPYAASGTPFAAKATIKIDITANGGDIFIPKYSAVVASSGIYATTSDNDYASATAYTFTSSEAIQQDDSWLVQNGETKQFEIGDIILANRDTSGHNAYAKISVVRWCTSDAEAPVASSTDVAWDLVGLRTDSVYLEPKY